MSVKYQEDQKERYEKMMEEIAGHPDFGKRNPVDIGIDCGYTEEKVMEMIQFLQDFKERPETGDRNGDDREKYYFLLGNGPHYIASVNINTWETEWVKDVRTMPYCFRIKGAIYAYALNRAKEHYLAWENLETGEKGKYHVDENIKDMLIVDNGIAAATERSFVLYPYQGEKIKIEYPHIGQSIKPQMLIEGKDAIYYVIYVNSYEYRSYEIWKVEKESLHESVIWESRMALAAAEYADGDLIWYVKEPCLSSYRKYSEKSLPNYKGMYKLPLDHRCNDCIIGSVRTKNYELWQRWIFGIEDKESICKFNRMLQNGNQETDGQVIGIYEKDIFVGVGKGNRNLIKVDLREEKTPVILRVHKK